MTYSIVQESFFTLNKFLIIYRGWQKIELFYFNFNTENSLAIEINFVDIVRATVLSVVVLTIGTTPSM